MSLQQVGMAGDMLNAILMAWHADSAGKDLLDLLFGVTAVVFNLQLVGYFIAVRSGHHGIARIYNLMICSMAFPFLVVLIGYIALHQSWWVMIGLTAVLVFLMVELCLKFILNVTFQNMLKLFVPYLLLLIVVQAALVGSSFQIGWNWGLAVAFTFWSLVTAISYSFWPLFYTPIRRSIAARFNMT